MRSALFALIAVCVALTVNSVPSLTAEDCMIGDAALCLAHPKCLWDGQRRGFYAGPATLSDACAAHEDMAICDISSLGCQWSDAAQKCESKTE